MYCPAVSRGGDRCALYAIEVTSEDLNALLPEQSPAAPRSPRRKWPWIVGALVVALLIVAVCGFLVYQRASDIRAELRSAQQLVPQVTQQVGALDVDTATDTFEQIATHTQNAVDLTEDPLWWVAQRLPWIGSSFDAVTQLSAVTNDTVTAARPLVQAATTLTPANLRPVDGRFPIEALEEASAIVTVAADDFAGLSSRLAAVPDDVAIDEIASAKTTLADALGELDSAVQTADTVLAVLPTILGGDGDKRYLLVFQNNAEMLGLGGSAASQTLVTASDGLVEISGQGSSRSYREELVDVEVADSALALYGRRYGSALNLTPSRPDWPSDAQIMRAFWQRDVDPGRIDGVASIDPLALAQMLKATGPITVNNVQLSSENAVSVLLHDVYTWYDGPLVGPRSDAFFAEAAAAVFDKLSSGDFDAAVMMTAIGESIESGSIMYWTEDESVTSILSETNSRIAGVLPTDNSDSTTVGVYFRDVSASKIDYFMDSTVNAVASCSADEMTLTVTATLRLDLTLEESVNLPDYVRSGSWDGTSYRTQVFMYAPQGMQIAETSFEGSNVRNFRQGNVDLGRQVAPFEANHVPGEEFTVTATFTGPAEDTGPLEVRLTPMIRPTDLTVDDSCG